MTEHGSRDQGTKGIFDAAGEVAKILEKHSKDEQQRILRLVVEGLALRDPVGKSQDQAPDAPGQQAVTAQPAADIKTFVSQKKPKSDQQLATVIAYFYRFVAPEASRKDAIGSEDLQTAGRQARGSGFKVPSATLNNTVNAGYLDKAGRGLYKINAVGENLVAMTLPGGNDDGSTGPTRRAARGRNSAKGRDKKSRRKRSPNAK